MEQSKCSFAAVGTRLIASASVEITLFIPDAINRVPTAHRISIMHKYFLFYL